MKYRINLLSPWSPEEKPAGARSGLGSYFTVLCFVVLGLSAGYTIYHVLEMKASLTAGRQEFGRVMAEHENRRTPENLVTPADIELLEKLRSERILWSEIMEILSGRLPGNYLITKLNYAQNKLKVAGACYAMENQNPLMQLHEYLTALQNEPDYRKSFHGTSLKSFVLSDKNQNLFFFEFNALGRQ